MTIELTMNPRRRQQNQFLIEKHLYPSTLFMISTLHIIVASIVWFELDPLPHYVEIFNLKPLLNDNLMVRGSVLLFRIITVSFLVYEADRFSIEYNILTICLFQTYEFYLSFLKKLKLPRDCLPYYKMLAVCHGALSPYINSLYFTTASCSQVI